jgi:hypothetical protein
MYVANVLQNQLIDPAKCNRTDILLQPKAARSQFPINGVVLYGSSTGRKIGSLWEVSSDEQICGHVKPIPNDTGQRTPLATDPKLKDNHDYR